MFMFFLFEFVLKHIRYMTEMYEVSMMQLGDLFCPPTTELR